MKQKWYRIIGLVLVAIVGACGVGAALHLFFTIPVRNNAADWVVAFGTIGALIGTIWLATAETRRRKQEEKDRAIVAFSSLHFKFQQFEKIFDEVIDHFSDPVNCSRNRFDYEGQAKAIGTVPTWSSDEILPLIIVPNHVCARLATVGPELPALMKRILEQHRLQKSNQPRERDVYGQGFMSPLHRLRTTVQSCRKECEAFLEKSR